MSTSWDAWTYRESAGYAPETGSVVGYRVHATDGDIGKVDEADDNVGAGWIVIDTGPWIFGHRVILPAGTVSRVDHSERKVYVDLEKDQIKDAPELGEASPGDDVYRHRLGSYYGEFYR